MIGVQQEIHAKSKHLPNYKRTEFRFKCTVPKISTLSAAKQNRPMIRKVSCSGQQPKLFERIEAKAVAWPSGLHLCRFVAATDNDRWFVACFDFSDG